MNIWSIIYLAYIMWYCIQLLIYITNKFKKYNLNEKNDPVHVSIELESPCDS